MYENIHENIHENIYDNNNNIINADIDKMYTEKYKNYLKIIANETNINKDVFTGLI